jgi:hypothetical protein
LSRLLVAGSHVFHYARRKAWVAEGGHDDVRGFFRQPLLPVKGRLATDGGVIARRPKADEAISAPKACASDGRLLR